MSFTATPVDGSSTPIPMSSAVPDGTNTPLAVEAGPSKVTGGNTLAPVAVYQYDGYDVTQGAQADAAVINPALSGSIIALLKGLLTELIDIEAQTTLTPTVSGSVSVSNFPGTQPVSAASLPLPAGAALEAGHLATIDTSTAATGTATGAQADTAVTGDTAGTLSAKLRGLSKILFDMWDSTNHWLQVKVMNANANGQNTMVNSAPVVLASDQFHAATTDGIQPAQLPASALYLYSAGGPPDNTLKPQLASFDRVASFQGKAVAGTNANISATTAGDTSLAFSAAPKSIMPGQKIQLSVGAGVPVEWVIVSLAYAVSASTTVIPLQYPVVNSGNTTAKWDVFANGGPGNASMLPSDMLPVILTGYNINAPGPAALLTATLDAQAVTNTLLAAPGLFNGTTIDKQRANLDVTLLASAARTTTQTSADIVNYNGRGIKVWLDMTVVGTGSVTLAINGKDPASGKYLLLLAGAAVVTNSTNVYTVYPNVAAVANVSVNDILPRTFQIVVTANNANSATYSCGYSLIL